MTTLTTHERVLLERIRAHIQQHGQSPTHEELARAFDVRSTSTIHHYLSRLEAKGRIRRRKYHGRSIELLEERCPYCGRSDGQPAIEAPETAP